MTRRLLLQRVPAGRFLPGSVERSKRGCSPPSSLAETRMAALGGWLPAPPRFGRSVRRASSLAESRRRRRAGIDIGELFEIPGGRDSFLPEGPTGVDQALTCTDGKPIINLPRARWQFAKA